MGSILGVGNNGGKFALPVPPSVVEPPDDPCVLIIAPLFSEYPLVRNFWIDVALVCVSMNKRVSSIALKTDCGLCTNTSRLNSGSNPLCSNPVRQPRLPPLLCWSGPETVGCILECVPQLLVVSV